MVNESPYEVPPKATTLAVIGLVLLGLVWVMFKAEARVSHRQEDIEMRLRAKKRYMDLCIEQEVKHRMRGSFSLSYGHCLERLNR